MSDQPLKSDHPNCRWCSGRSTRALHRLLTTKKVMNELWRAALPRILAARREVS